MIGVESRVTTPAQSPDIYQFRAFGNQTANRAAGTKTIGFYADNSLRDSLSNDANVYGFYTDLAGANDRSNTYAVYCAGTAANYFGGLVTVSLDNGFLAQTATSGSGVNIGTAALSVARHGTNTSDSPMYVNRMGHNSGFMIRFGQNGSFAASMGIRGDGLNSIALVGTSDYRLKQNVADISNASDVVKNLRPVSFSFTGEPERTHQGFIAHELQEHVPNATFGEKDATEAIGTLLDWDGTELETEVVEPSTEELTYTEEVETDGVATMVTRTRSWSATGTRDVYQGVDQSKLIPILTKALQEALARIEELESNTLQPVYQTAG